jgi:hypothetical protein
VTNLKIVMNVAVLTILSLLISEFAVNNLKFYEITENFSVIRQSYNRISEIQRIAYDVRTLVNINERQQVAYRNYTTAPDFIEYLKVDIGEALDNLFMLQGNISMSNLQLNADHHKLAYEKSVNLYFIQSGSKLQTLTFSLSEAVQ